MPADFTFGPHDLCGFFPYRIRRIALIEMLGLSSNLPSNGSWIQPAEEQLCNRFSSWIFHSSNEYLRKTKLIDKDILIYKTLNGFQCRVFKKIGIDRRLKLVHWRILHVRFVNSVRLLIVWKRIEFSRSSTDRFSFSLVSGLKSLWTRWKKQKPNIDSFYLLKIMINISAYTDVQEFPARQIPRFVSQNSCLEEF